MQYQRPVAKFTDDWIEYHKMHMEFMERCYRDHTFDHTVSYEDLFEMDELCGVPLKDYHGQFTFKLNKLSINLPYASSILFVIPKYPAKC